RRLPGALPQEILEVPARIAVAAVRRHAQPCRAARPLRPGAFVLRLAGLPGAARGGARLPAGEAVPERTGNAGGMAPGPTGPRHIFRRSATPDRISSFFAGENARHSSE